MDAEQLDGLLVALRSMAKDNVPAALVEAISRVQALHARAAHHGIDLAMARIEDGSGIFRSLCSANDRTVEKKTFRHRPNTDWIPARICRQRARPRRPHGVGC